MGHSWQFLSQDGFSSGNLSSYYRALKPQVGFLAHKMPGQLSWTWKQAPSPFLPSQTICVHFRVWLLMDLPRLEVKGADPESEAIALQPVVHTVRSGG